MRGRADILVAFIRAASQSWRARSQQTAEQQIRKNSILPPNPHMLTRHRSSAELRVVGIETSLTESLTVEPSPESNDLAMSRLRTRNDYQSLRWPSSFTQPVYEYSKKKEPLHCCTQQYCCNSPRVLGTQWVHTLGHLESTNLSASVAARSVSNCS